MQYSTPKDGKVAERVSRIMRYKRGVSQRIGLVDTVLEHPTPAHRPGYMLTTRACDAVPAGWRLVSNFDAGGSDVNIIVRVAQEVASPFGLRQPSLASDFHVHSGHSLTDTYVNSGIDGWPGNLPNLFIGEFGEAAWVHQNTHAQDTVPGSPMSIRWERQDLLARTNIDTFQSLVITEGGPPPRVSEPASEGMIDTLTHLMLFSENALSRGDGGKGAEVVLWSIWPSLNGLSDHPEWADLGSFRACLPEYGRSFRYLADYATWKMHQNHADLPPEWRVWIIPGHAWMARIYDDLLGSAVPGLTTIGDLYRDDIHLNPVGEYAASLLVFTMLYQIDARELKYVPSPDVIAPELDAYLKRVAWEVVTSEEVAGLGGTANSGVAFDPALHRDPLD